MAFNNSNGLPRFELAKFWAPIFLLPCALLIPPSMLSHTKLAAVFFPVIAGCDAYNVLYNSGPGLISAMHLLWSGTLLLFRRPPRRLSTHPSIVSSAFRRRHDCGGVGRQELGNMRERRGKVMKPSMTSQAG